MSTHSITKEQIVQLSKDSLSTKIKLKQWFPELFFKPGWYKKNYNSFDYFVYLKNEDDRMAKGFFNGSWGDWSISSDLKEICNRVGYDDVKDFLISFGKDNGKINVDEDTEFWQYSEIEDSLYDNDHNVVYVRGSWILVNEWMGEGWYQCKWRDDIEAFVYRKHVSDNTGHGFYNRHWSNEIHFSLATSINHCFSSKVEHLFKEEAIRLGYTRENIVSLGGDPIFNTNVDKWTFLSDTMYTSILGNGGMIVYKNGVWASKII
jgi:hypothetical protein